MDVECVVIGKHRITVEKSIVIGAISSPWTQDEMREYFALVLDVYKRCGSVYLMTIIKPGYALSPEARKYIAEWGKQYPDVVAGNVIVGASLAIRAVLRLAQAAARLLSPTRLELTLVDTEEQARDFIARDQEARQAAAKPV